MGNKNGKNERYSNRSDIPNNNLTKIWPFQSMNCIVLISYNNKYEANKNKI